jgi:hypothetical protein
MYVYVYGAMIYEAICNVYIYVYMYICYIRYPSPCVTNCSTSTTSGVMSKETQKVPYILYIYIYIHIYIYM